MDASNDPVQPPPLFTKREKYALAILTISFIVLSAGVHVVLGGIGSALFPQFKKEAAAPPQRIVIETFQTPTPTPVPVPTPTPRMVATARPQTPMHRATAPPVRVPPRPPITSSGKKPLPDATATPSNVHGAATAVPVPTLAASPAPSATPALVTDADFIRKTEPAYPELALEENVEGQVTVRVTIGPDGRVEDVVLVTSSGSRLLDDAAIEAAETSSFRPPLENGVPTTRDYLIIYTFTLDA